MKKIKIKIVILIFLSAHIATTQIIQLKVIDYLKGLTVQFYSNKTLFSPGIFVVRSVYSAVLNTAGKLHSLLSKLGMELIA